MDKIKILCLGKLPQTLTQRLYDWPQLGDLKIVERKESLTLDELKLVLQDRDVVLSEPQDNLKADVLKHFGNLKMIAQRAVGYDNIDLPFCSSNNILVTNTPGVLDNATADLAFSLLLATARRIVEADKYVRENRWEGFESDLLLGAEISGKTLGIIGLGRIGQAMARRASGFGLQIIYTREQSNDNTLDAKDQVYLQKFGARRVTMAELLTQSDFISVHCPLNSKTTGLINSESFAAMKAGCIFVNTARGKVVDQGALVEAVLAGKIKAGLDVFADEPQVPEALKLAPNVVLAPHIGSATSETRFKMAELAVQAIIHAVDEHCPANSLNPQIFANFIKNIKVTSR
jgi:glyoxylate reductase